jgi:hypothetical protein
LDFIGQYSERKHIHNTTKVIVTERK